MSPPLSRDNSSLDVLFAGETGIKGDNVFLGETDEGRVERDGEVDETWGANEGGEIVDAKADERTGALEAMAEEIVEAGDVELTTEGFGLIRGEED